MVIFFLDVHKSKGDKVEALLVRNLRKVYAQNSGIFDVHLTVKQGTLHGFLGVNGAGKTTTMKCIMSLLKKDSGTIELFGKELQYDNPSSKIKIGFSQELPVYPPYFTGLEILTYYGKMRGLSRSECKSESSRTIKLVGLEDVGNKKIGKYSRGMLARIGVAVALLGQPELLVLDEPTSGLDPVAAENIRNLLSNLVKEGKTILFSSHQLHDVQKICSSLTVIDKGRTIMEGETEDLLSRKARERVFIAEFDSLTDEITAEVNSLTNVGSVFATENKHNSLTLTTLESQDVRGELARIAVKHNSYLLTCTEEKADLETTFLSMVKKDEEEEKTGPRDQSSQRT